MCFLKMFSPKIASKLKNSLVNSTTFSDILINLINFSAKTSLLFFYYVLLYQNEIFLTTENAPAYLPASKVIKHKSHVEQPL